MDSPPPPGAYHYRATLTRRSVEGDLGSPHASGGHYVGLTPEVSSVSGPISRSASAAITSRDFRSPLEPGVSAAHAGSRNSVSGPASMDTVSTSATDVSLLDATRRGEGSTHPAEIWQGQQQHEEQPAAPFMRSLSQSVEELALRSASSLADDAESDDDASDTPLLPMLSVTVAEQVAPVDVLRARIRALGTAILRITETALMDTGANLEDSLKLEHKVGPRRKKKRTGRRAAAGGADAGRPLRSAPRASTGGTRREPGSTRPNAAPRTKPRPATTPLRKTGKPTDTSAAAALTKTPPAKKRPMEDARAAAESPTAAAGEGQAASPERCDTPHAHDFYVPPPEVVMAALERSASCTARYASLLAKRKREMVAGGAAGSDDGGVLEEEEHQGESEEEEGTDRAPLYDASNTAAAVGSLAQTWAEVRRRRLSVPDPLAAAEGDEGFAACGVEPLSVATLAGDSSADWTTLSPTVLRAKELTEEERSAVKDRLQPCSPGEASDARPAASAEDERSRCFAVLYLHRFDDQGHANDPADPTSAWAVLEEMPSLEESPGTRPSRHQSNSSAARFGKTHYRALFSGPSRGSSAPPQQQQQPVRVELNVGRVNSRVRSYAQHCVTGGLRSSSSPHARREHTAAGGNNGKGDPLLSPPDRSASESSQTPAIEGRIRRLENWQTARHLARDMDRRRRRRHSLFTHPKTVDLSPGAVSAQFYYYAPLAGAAEAGEEELLPYDVGNRDEHEDGGSGCLTPPHANGSAVVDVLLSSPVRVVGPIPLRLQDDTAPSIPEAVDEDQSVAAAEDGDGGASPSVSAPRVDAEEDGDDAVDHPAEDTEDGHVAAAAVPSRPTTPPPPRTAGVAQQQQQQQWREPTPSSFLEVVVASGYDSVEWLFSGAARRRQNRKYSGSWDETTEVGPTHPQQQPATSSAPLATLTPVHQQPSAPSQGTCGVNSLTSSSLTPVAQKQPHHAAVRVFVGQTE